MPGGSSPLAYTAWSAPAVIKILARKNPFWSVKPSLQTAATPGLLRLPAVRYLQFIIWPARGIRPGLRARCIEYKRAVSEARGQFVYSAVFLRFSLKTDLLAFLVLAGCSLEKYFPVLGIALILKLKSQYNMPIKFQNNNYKGFDHE